MVFKKCTDIDSKIINFKGHIRSTDKKRLDKDPAIKGKVGIRLKTAENGWFLDVSIQQKEMNYQDFLNKLIKI